LCLNADGQDFNASVIAGINASRTRELGVNFNKLGMSVGLAASRQLATDFFGEIQVLYNQKGQLNQPDSAGIIHGNLSLEYAEMALRFGYAFSSMMRAGIGASYGKLIRNSEIIDGVHYKYGPDQINRTDISLQIFVLYRLFERFTGEFIYIHQINMLRNIWDFESNSTVGIRVSYTFLGGK